MSDRALLRELFDRAVAVADPMRFIGPNLPERPQGRLLVVGAGKASARMAEAVEAEWGPCDGLVITRYGYGRPTRGIEIVEAAHPVPDQAGVDATARMLDLLGGLRADDLVVMLISGGASALLCAPAGEMTLAEKQAVNAALLASGAPIGQMNLLRKHLSRVKGGQLAAAAAPARVVALMISDVPGDDPAMIGSGPTVGDGSTDKEAREIVSRWQIALPESAQAVLNAGSGVIPPGDARLARVENRVVAAPAQSLDAAAELLAARGIESVILGDDLNGEAREVAQDHARLALEKQAALSGDEVLVILSGGELTVTRRGDGVGGPNAEYALALAVALNGAEGILAIACDTDGVDGAAEVAGAIITPDTLARARDAGLDPARALDRNDAHSFFGALGDQVVPGPTLTNVNDFRAILIRPA
ncbi:hydroxypyruvate reductase [Paracoccus isoporae]|uniref:Hydroxypyruvate reductase n=1 Tax=Paracoccus isoporae TaxID=591205 RepID=A0A1G6X1L5_9RHOB|nr:glycerate kinase [Paracoccus isoporae]SDD71145.1 hydroxypyruvate reductase [Paracoccus isoporae]